MSREFQLKEIEGKKCIAFPFQSVREVDDIILQLLNDADQDGFLKSKVNKAQKEIVFDADGLTSLENLPASVLPRDQFIHVLEDLKDMLVYLEDSFIGPEYVSFDEKSVFIDPDTGKLYLTVLPLQNPGHDDYSMQGLVKNLISKFSPEEADAFYDLAASRVSSGITKISDLENMINRLKDEAAKEPSVKVVPDAAENAAEEAVAEEAVTEKAAAEISDEETAAETAAVEQIAEEIPVEEVPVAEIPIEDAPVAEIPAEEVPEEIPVEEVTAAEIPVETAAEEIHVKEIPAAEEIIGEQSIEEEAATEVSAIEKAAIEETPDRTMYFDKQTGDELNAALAAAEAALPTAFDAERRGTEQPVVMDIPEIEVPAEEIPALEVSAEPETEIPAAEVSAEPETESPAEEVPAEPESDVPAEPESEVPAEDTPAEPELTAYLFRKKSSELIPLTSNPFVIGKIPVACDYVITDNPALSRIHTMIRYAEEEEAYFIIDCNSTNHVYVNGNRVTGQQIAKLADKDRIHLATEEFVFNIQK